MSALSPLAKGVLDCLAEIYAGAPSGIDRMTLVVAHGLSVPQAGACFRELLLSGSVAFHADIDGYVLAIWPKDALPPMTAAERALVTWASTRPPFSIKAMVGEVGIVEATADVLCLRLVAKGVLRRDSDGFFELDRRFLT